MIYVTLITFIAIFYASSCAKEDIDNRYSTKLAQKPNILLLLADDLGYGDTSVEPFIGSGVQTPNLEKMAKRGLKLTNFHTAAPTCTPTRASILTGLFPWRLGIKAVFEYGEKGKSNRDDWLAQVPTLAMILKEANYSTGHSGKWHVGGMRNDDLDMRTLNEIGYDSFGLPLRGSKRCPHPGPNQQGFDDYVSVLDGPGSPRQNTLQLGSCLYSRGCEHLLRNDMPMAKPIGRELLSDCEVKNAVAMIESSVSKNQPFFVQVWFHAPHGPWEVIPEYSSLYSGMRDNRNQGSVSCKLDSSAQFCTTGNPPVTFNRKTNKMHQYRTMISAMDHSIGKILNTLRDLNIENNTIVVFLSDNGPEQDTGTTGFPWNTTAEFRGIKRYLYEGGIRVPCIWYWPGVIGPGKTSNILSVSTDLLPTLLDAVGVPLPSSVLLDGMSIFPELVSHQHHITGRKKNKKAISERLLLWHSDFEGPRSAAATAFEFKLMLDAQDKPSEFFDLHNDPFERKNIFPQISKQLHEWSNVLPSNFHFKPEYFLNESFRHEKWLQKHIAFQLYPILKDFVDKGNLGHVLYSKNNPGRQYRASLASESRHVHGDTARKIRLPEHQRQRNELLHQSTCQSPCNCSIPEVHEVPSFSFHQVFHDVPSIIPRGFINATELLFG